MSPLLRPGDRIHVRRAKPEQIRCGDIIVYAQRKPNENHLKVHRVLLRRQTPRGVVFWTKGDRERHLDDPVPAFAVIGVVAGRERNSVLQLLRTPLRRAQGVALAAVGVLAVIARRFPAFRAVY